MAVRKCDSCGEEMDSNSLFCTKCGKKQKKKNIILFFILMVISFFLIFELAISIIISILYTTITNYKYGTDIIAEILLIISMIVVLLLFGNSYVFKEKKVGFFKGIVMALPMLLFSVLIFIESAIGALNGLNLANLINLLVLCLGVGIAEEFLCRAWLQNEFIERFGATRNGVLLSIFFSSLVFGGMHISNAFVTSQGLFETLQQIIQAVGSGFLLGAVYYKTRNIWVNSFLHGFFDFAIMLGEVNLLKDCVSNYGTDPGSRIIAIASSLLLVGFYVSCGFFILSSKHGLQIFKKKNLKKIKIVSSILCVVFIVLTFIPGLFGSESVTICYKYDKKVISEVYEITTTNKKDYLFEYEGYTVKVKKGHDDDQDILLLTINDKKVNLNFEKEIKDYLLIGNKEYIDIIVYTEDKNGSVVYYGKLYANKLEEVNDDFVKELEDYVLPDLEKIGYIKFENSYDVRPYMETKLKEMFFIDKDNKLYLIK